MAPRAPPLPPTSFLALARHEYTNGLLNWGGFAPVRRLREARIVDSPKELSRPRVLCEDSREDRGGDNLISPSCGTSRTYKIYGFSLRRRRESPPSTNAEGISMTATTPSRANFMSSGTVSSVVR